ncbi:nucleus export protein BRR6 [Penicillium cosmopolitanum]|uniref:Nucleus export protein BRR6 n=1 Tax=Penicillium cosmopolitanum TaxID=1131564 RepID=A0A9W9SC97_9EURO|nr:nucleus export protein BRR6 [Penicillium cosmopolitanum]KAJ5375993.1 nucleus export protein BRR6 [Penicillium cosmopolitanum]
MQSRTAESPMEFEWQHRQPGDASSGFHQVALQHENKKPHLVLLRRQKSPVSAPPIRILSFSLNNRLRPHPHPSPRKALHKPPRFGQSAWTTPRKPAEIDFSSGAENFSSPENADNEDTPEQPYRHERQNSLFNNRGRFAPNASPGRGEIRKNHYSGAVARRVFKKRQRDKEIGRRVRVDSDDDSDRPSSSEGLPGKTNNQKRYSKKRDQATNSSALSQLFTFLESHPNMPSILSWWAQLTLNVSIFSMAVYVVWSVLQSIRGEFQHMAEQESSGILTEIHDCARDYLTNGCESPNRAPALKKICDGWQVCMDRDPAKIGHAKLSAATMATIINSFIEPISWKAVIIFLVAIAFRNNLNNQQGYMQQAGYSNSSDMNRMYHPGLLHHHSMPNYGFPPQQQSHQLAPSSAADAEKENMPLRLEAPNMDFVTERSRDREAHLRSPSPSKRTRQFS